MVSKLLTLLFILPIIYAKVEIEISTTDEKGRDVALLGSDVEFISDTEQKSFGLTDEKLKKTITTLLGLAPDNVYLKNPTPFGGLYTSFNWEPVKRVFIPKRASMHYVETKPYWVTSKDITNEDSELKSFMEEIRQNLDTTVSSKWEKDDELSVDDIHYHLDLKKPEDSMHFIFTAKWGENVQKSMPVNVKSDVEFKLKPKQKAIFQVLATKETMKINVDYETSLLGTVVANYDKEYNGHRLWAMDINTVLEAGGLKKESQSSELIEVVHYTDANVLIKDADTNEVIYSADLEMN